MNEQDKELAGAQKELLKDWREKGFNAFYDRHHIYHGVLENEFVDHLLAAQKAQTQDDERKRAAESTVEMINKLFNIMAKIIDPEKLEGFRKLQNRKVEECKQKILNPEAHEA